MGRVPAVIGVGAYDLQVPPAEVARVREPAIRIAGEVCRGGGPGGGLVSSTKHVYGSASSRAKISKSKCEEPVQCVLQLCSK